MAKTVYNMKRHIDKFKRFKCAICGREYTNENFAIDNEEDCPICENKDCAKQI